MGTIKNASSVREAIEIAKEKQLEYPKKPIKPVSRSFEDTPKGMREYANALEKYDSEYDVYSQKLKKYREHKQKLDSQVVDFIKEETGLNDIPKKYQDKVYNYAYQQGHSSGYSEVACILYDLVEIFNV